MFGNLVMDRGRWVRGRRSNR